jgi:hypothetical protein
MKLINYQRNYLCIDLNHWSNPSKNIYYKSKQEVQKNSLIFLKNHQSKKVIQILLLMNMMIVPYLKVYYYYNHAKIIMLSLINLYYLILIVYFIQKNLQHPSYKCNIYLDGKY